MHPSLFFGLKQALRLIRVDIMDLPMDNMEEVSDESGIEGGEGIGRDSNETELAGREGRAKGSWEDAPTDLGNRVEGVMAKVRSANMLGETAKLEVS